MSARSSANSEGGIAGKMALSGCCSKAANLPFQVSLSIPILLAHSAGEREAKLRPFLVRRSVPHINFV